MILRINAHLAKIVLLALALLVPAAAAHADAAYDRVAAAYAQSGGQLDPCQFTQAQLQEGLAGIPAAVRDVVPDLKRALRDGVAAHQRGDCAGREPGAATTQAGAVPPVTTEAPAPTPAPAPVTTTTTTPAPASSGQRTHADDRTALLVGLIALGAALLGALLLWGWARMRGWDSTYSARMRHAWGEAGFRVSTTWSEFGDWLRLGR